jgi:pseudaminic acid biosynthesis-associated methylase
MSNEHLDFWRGDFGNDYISRNESPELLASNIHFFEPILHRLGSGATCLEVGANIGMNVQAIRKLRPDIDMYGLEPNEKAWHSLKSQVSNTENAFCDAIQDFNPKRTWDMVFTKGVLIHVTPEDLPAVYTKLARLTARYLLIAEYYNPQPVSLPYRGHENRLYKRDFAGEFLRQEKGFSLIDYKFVYRGDPVAPQDDITWFLLEKHGTQTK